MTLTDSGFPQYSLVKSFLLSVLPGVLVTVAFLLFKHLLDPVGYPSLFAFLHIRLSISLHVFANTLTRLMFLMAALAM